MPSPGMGTDMDTDIRTIMAEPLALLRLLQLASPALPVGAFNFSQGLEFAHAQGWVTSEQHVGAWIEGVAEHSLAGVDLPLLLRLHTAWSADSPDQAWQFSSELVATRESHELRAEERHMGQSLAKILVEYGIHAAKPWVRDANTSYAAMFALAAVSAHATAQDCLLAYAWSWTENQVTAAVKLLPLGQSAGQRLLESLRQRLPGLVASATSLTDAEIGSAAPGAMMASCWHETQYTRLFRS